MKKLTKGIEESKKEKERLIEEKEKLKGVFKEIEQKAFVVQENYKKTQEVLYSFFSSFNVTYFQHSEICKMNYLLRLNHF